MKRVTLILFTVFLALGSYAQNVSYKVEKIWGNGQHCAFTSLIEYDGKNGYDLRDPKLSVTPDGRLMISLGGSIYRNRKLVGGVSHVIFSKDGKNFSEPIPIVLDKEISSERDWIWRITWQGDTGYGVNYDGKDRITLLSTKDGINYSLVQQFNMDGFPNEATVRFLNDSTMSMMVRREGGDKKGYFGISEAPFKEWKWEKLPMFIGGPDYILIDDENIVAGGRSIFIPNAHKTVLFTAKMPKMRFQESIVLPSGGDTSYPGFLVVGDELWVSYYSSHATPNASIYLAKIPLDVILY